MANLVVGNMKLFILDTNYFFWNKPIAITSIILYPSAAGDAATISSYNPADTVRATKTGQTVAVATNNTITSTGNFAAAALVSGDLLTITKTDLAQSVPAGQKAEQYGWDNLGVFIASRTSDDVAVVYGHGGSTTPLTNDATGVYSWTTIAPYTSIPLLSPATEKQEIEATFDGTIFPNFALTALSASAKVYIYYR